MKGSNLLKEWPESNFERLLDWAKVIYVHHGINLSNTIPFRDKEQYESILKDLEDTNIKEPCISPTSEKEILIVWDGLDKENLQTIKNGFYVDIFGHPLCCSIENEANFRRQQIYWNNTGELNEKFLQGKRFYKELLGIYEREGRKGLENYVFLPHIPCSPYCEATFSQGCSAFLEENYPQLYEKGLENLEIELTLFENKVKQ